MNEKQKVIFVNNNMDIGGVQKSLINLLNEIKYDFDITLLLFSDTGENIINIPSEVKVITTNSFFECLGVSQRESKKKKSLYFLRGFLALITKIFGRKYGMKLVLMSQKKLSEKYDFAISFLQNGGNHSFYGGCNEFVLNKINANEKITFLHCDYNQCGANTSYNNLLYRKFDKIAACSEGCRKSFLNVLPDLKDKCYTVTNCHDFKNIKSLSCDKTIEYDQSFLNVISVARLSQEKGIERGIKAIKYCKDRGEKIKYHVIGDGILKSELLDLTSELNLTDDVILHGNKKNPYRYMKNADLLLIPSFHEAAPLVIDEALCLNLPVLSTKTTSAEDMILNREIGWVSDNSTNELCKTLFKINKDSVKIKKNVLSNIKCNNNKAVQEFYEILEARYEN